MQDAIRAEAAQYDNAQPTILYDSAFSRARLLSADVLVLERG
jgi:hypothetical protein